MSKITKERFNEILREEIARERNKQKELNEIFGLGDLGSGILGSIGGGEGVFGGAIKQKIASSILKSFGMTDGPAVEVFSQIIEQFTLEELKMIWKGGVEQCPLATRKIFQALCEIMGKELYKKVLSASSDIPGLGAITGWLGGGGLLNQVGFGLTSEFIENQLSDANTPIGGWMHANVLPPLEIKVCKVITDFQTKSMTDIALGREGDAPAAASGDAPSDATLTPTTTAPLAAPAVPATSI